MPVRFPIGVIVGKDDEQLDGQPEPMDENRHARMQGMALSHRQGLSEQQGEKDVAL